MLLLAYHSHLSFALSLSSIFSDPVSSPPSFISLSLFFLSFFVSSSYSSPLTPPTYAGGVCVCINPGCRWLLQDGYLSRGADVGGVSTYTHTYLIPSHPANSSVLWKYWLLLSSHSDNGSSPGIWICLQNPEIKNEADSTYMQWGITSSKGLSAVLWIQIRIRIHMDRHLVLVLWIWIRIRIETSADPQHWQSVHYYVSVSAEKIVVDIIGERL